MMGMKQFIHSYLSSLTFTYSDVLEIIILSFVVYHILIWIRNTRAWTLMKGILVMIVFIFIATLLNLDSILFLVSKGINAILVATAVIFQPELRRALEQLGEKKFLSSLLPFDMEKDAEERFSDKTVNELVKGSFEMGKAKTGALIVLEKNTKLTEYIRTGIELDSLVTSQLLLNIFEHNTPLHDGAIIVRGNRIISATCYLPLSDNMELSKELGTRHRAGVGISEVTDSLTIIVSEETGKVSIAQKGVLTRDVTPEELAGMITTETPTDTRIMSISVTDDDPKEAKQIADTLRKAVSVQITEIMSADSVNTVEEGNLPTSPSSPNVKKNMMLGALLGLVISMGFIVLISILDDTVKTPDDVEKYLGLNVLTSIPIQEGSSAPKRAKQQRESRNAVKSRR